MPLQELDGGLLYMGHEPHVLMGLLEEREGGPLKGSQKLLSAWPSEPLSGCAPAVLWKWRWGKGLSQVEELSGAKGAKRRMDRTILTRMIPIVPPAGLQESSRTLEEESHTVRVHSTSK